MHKIGQQYDSQELRTIIAEEYKQIVTSTAPRPDELVDIDDHSIYSKNRYHDIVPKKKTRVLLNNSYNNYINANWVNSPYSRSILTQAPLEETIEDFWKMVWEQNINIIVMVTNIKENGRTKSTFYWSPKIPNDSESIAINEHKVPIITKNAFGSIIVSTLELVWKGQKKIVSHVHFPDWNDFQTPKSTESIHELLKIINKLEKEYHNDPIKNPILYHCSAGIGRSGTLLAIRMGFEYLNRNIKPVIPKIVTNIRTARAQCVQTVDQYTFIYKTIFNI